MYNIKSTLTFIIGELLLRSGFHFLPLFLSIKLEESGCLKAVFSVLHFFFVVCMYRIKRYVCPNILYSLLLTDGDYI